MPVAPDVLDITVRILLTLVAAAALGLERGTHGKAAGLRTTLLVALAACLAMIEVNFLLSVVGKTPQSFAQIDPMRLPLGILTGVGFIGAGVILKRGVTVVGVTTAASMWFVTVIGLVFGSGQIWLGVAGSILGFLVVQPLRVLERRVPRDREAMLTIRTDRRAADGDELERAVVQPPFRLVRIAYAFDAETQSETRTLRLSWKAHEGEVAIPRMVQALREQPGVLAVKWDAGGIADD